MINFSGNADAELTNQDMEAIKRLDRDQKKTKDDVSYRSNLEIHASLPNIALKFLQVTTRIYES